MTKNDPGKSYLAARLAADYAARHGGTVVIISWEMSQAQLMARLRDASSVTGS